MQETNKLINEKSPYLLQHVHNPVNWYPWGEEAFKKAKEMDLPILLSIGYSTCHWCHVMAHESFENEEVAKYLNDNYISIKVDREERPDIDSMYMNICQALTGSGGWPLTVFIDYDKKPIYAGTYYPKKSFMSLLERISELWESDREYLENNTKKIINHITIKEHSSEEVDIEVTNTAFKQYSSSYDSDYGGLSKAPKFPTPHKWMFLMKYYQYTKNDRSLEMVIKTLDSMRAGGIYDHIGYGFCRYSTDEKWLVPHFEKMLYDNALLIITYMNAYQITKSQTYIDTAKEIATYLLRKMKSPEGGFYTAEDADSEGVEGKFYVFSYKEIEDILKDKAELYMYYFNITDNGNFEGMNIPNLISKTILDKDKEYIEECRKKIFDYQNKRIHPNIDDKILTSYNGLVISAFSILGRITKDDKYLDIAQETADFIISKMFLNNKLMSRYKEGEVKNLGFDEDYAYTIMGLIDLYESVLDKTYLDMAIKLNNIFIDQFYDEENGGFYQTDKDGEVILFRRKEIYDGATPSSNSVEIYNLLRLYHLTEEERLNDIANKSINCFGRDIKQYPAGYSFYNISLLYKQYSPTIITLVANNKADLNELLEVIHNSKIPFIEIKYVYNGSYTKLEDKPTAYVCKGKTCLPPINNSSVLAQTLSI